MTLAAAFILLVFLHIKKLVSSIQHPELEVSALHNDFTMQGTSEQTNPYWTIAIFGVDSRDNNLAKGSAADAQILCTLNKNTGDIKLISIYRDTLMQLDKQSDNYNKISGAYLRGGPVQAASALNNNLDLQIDDYMSFSWIAAAEAINLLGGIDIEITDSEWLYINAFITETVHATGIPSNHLKKSGLQHLDGVQAVAYGRLRLMDTDMIRTERQRKVIELIFKKAKDADWNVLNQVLTTVLPKTATNQQTWVRKKELV